MPNQENVTTTAKVIRKSKKQTKAKAKTITNAYQRRNNHNNNHNDRTRRKKNRQNRYCHPIFHRRRRQKKWVPIVLLLLFVIWNYYSYQYTSKDNFDFNNGKNDKIQRFDRSSLKKNNQDSDRILPESSSSISPCSRYKGILWISQGDVEGAAGTIFLFVLI